ncbi:DUF4302 domain-containing protein [Chitinophaga japonensis]|uniref:Uncharacterized protein DUF4302 n=1 Tax=Chitinophaga japonensis TaxID=104662 RepID=A0A562SV33_CHIJA|nr:DUF4302 domain-containing protein [Chitinophaga japonensis]TWI84510.1 uncharacterized protein DUF4302 [Chitinophaga japonensis]
MRKHLLYLSLFIAIFSACDKEDDPVFEQSPDERLNETLAMYQDELTGAPHGWKAMVFPAGIPRSVFSFYMKFNESNRVSMFSDFDAASSVTLQESSYRLKALQQPSLLFDTYSYLHVLCDPDGSVNGGVYGKGYYSDFEFALDSIAGDTIHLTGRFNKSKAYLVKATQQEEQEYMSLERNREFEHYNQFLTYFKRLTVGNAQYELTVNPYAHVIGFTWVDENGEEQHALVGFYYTPNGIAFAPAFTDGENTIPGLEDISWDAEGQLMSFTINGAAATISGFAKPLVVDTAAAQRWWDQGLSQEYWMSAYGFHVNGEDDAFGITSLPSYYFLGFWPGYGSNYDLLGFVTVIDNRPTLTYGPALRRPTFTSDGRIRFSYLDDLGTFPPDATPVHNTRIQLTDAAGYYLVQVNDSQYDMVSAKDGKAWITWFR